MRLGELIAIARECKGWTLRDLEKVGGVSNALISQIETGKVKDPGFYTVVRLCDALGLSVERVAKTVRANTEVLRSNGIRAKLDPMQKQLWEEFAKAHPELFEDG